MSTKNELALRKASQDGAIDTVNKLLADGVAQTADEVIPFLLISGYYTVVVVDNSAFLVEEYIIFMLCLYEIKVVLNSVTTYFFR